MSRDGLRGANLEESPVEAAAGAAPVFQVQFQNVELGALIRNKEPLQAGAFGQVFACVYGRDSSVVKLPKNESKHLKYLARELEFFKSHQITSDYVMQLKAIVMNDGQFYGLIFPKFTIDLGELLRGSYENKKLSNEEKFKVIEHILEGIDYLHDDLRAIHRDLKAENVLVSIGSDDQRIQRAVICDFDASLSVTDLAEMPGSSINLDKYTVLVGTEEYYPLEHYELLFSKSPDDQVFPYSRDTDIWALGVLLFAVFAGYYPQYLTVEQADEHEYFDEDECFDEDELVDQELDDTDEVLDETKASLIADNIVQFIGGDLLKELQTRDGIPKTCAQMLVKIFIDCYDKDKKFRSRPSAKCLLEDLMKHGSVGAAPAPAPDANDADDQQAKRMRMG